MLRNTVIISIILWCSAEIILALIKRADKSQAIDAKSLRILWLTSVTTATIGVTWSIYYSGQFGSEHILLNSISLVLIIAGIIIRYIAIFSLRHFFTVNVAIREDHEIIKTGLYKYIRHPAYTGLLIAMYGSALFLANLISFLLIVIPISFAMLHRIRIEEQVLCQYFGDQYRDYMHKTYRLIPGVF